MRTFIAIELSSSIQKSIAESQSALKERVEAAGMGGAVRWTSVDNIHLTLRFLSDTSTVQRDSIAAALAAITASQRPFRLTLDGLGCFPNLHRPAVIWLGIGGDLAILATLQTRIESAARDAGFEPERRAYSPHLTIGRVQRNAKSHARRELGQALQGFDPPHPTTSFTIDHIIHIRSVLQPSGAVHTPLAQYWF